PDHHAPGHSRRTGRGPASAERAGTRGEVQRLTSARGHPTRRTPGRKDTKTQRLHVPERKRRTARRGRAPSRNALRVPFVLLTLRFCAGRQDLALPLASFWLRLCRAVSALRTRSGRL